MEKNLTELLNEVVETKRSIERMEDAPDVLRHVGVGTAKNALKAQLEEKMAAVKDVASSVAVAIFVDGPGADKFVELAEDTEGLDAVVLSADSLYRDIAGDWFPTVRVDRQFELDCVTPFVGALHRVIYPLGVLQIASPNFGTKLGRRVDTFEDAVALTREIMREAVGDELNVLYLRDALPKRLIEFGEWGSPAIVPVVVLNATPEETSVMATMLFPGPGAGGASPRGLQYTAKENVEANDVLVVFKHLKDKLFPKKSRRSTAV